MRGPYEWRCEEDSKVAVREHMVNGNVEGGKWLKWGAGWQEKNCTSNWRGLDAGDERRARELRSIMEVMHVSGGVNRREG